jgi:hypothetical protein
MVRLRRARPMRPPPSGRPRTDRFVMGGGGAGRRMGSGWLGYGACGFGRGKAGQPILLLVVGGIAARGVQGVGLHWGCELRGGG